MADERDEREGEPKIRIVDRRMLDEDERAGKGPSSAAEGASAPPKLEIVGGGARQDEDTSAGPNGLDAGAAEDHGFGGSFEDAGELEDEPLTEEEQQQIQAEIEQAEEAQFQAIEQRMGRPLTEQEKEAVRAEMNRQAQAVASLEVAPILQNLMAELSSIAAVHMGLMPNPYTRLIARNDTQARLAIDAFTAVLQVVKPQLEPQLEQEFERVLNDLRVNFVSITGTPMGNPGGSGPSRIIH
ncbi:MAG: DUF1844 domain-containing protein [Abitibacteriaceae bacterium]|nr:DUF1844 domain-containing protein [Abditibacteriaceae bacterium]